MKRVFMTVALIVTVMLGSTAFARPAYTPSEVNYKNGVPPSTAAQKKAQERARAANLKATQRFWAAKKAAARKAAAQKAPAQKRAQKAAARKRAQSAAKRAQKKARRGVPRWQKRHNKKWNKRHRNYKRWKNNRRVPYWKRR